MAATAAARGSKQSRQRSVFVKAEKERDDDGQSAAAKDVRAERAVFRAENKQSDKNPKGYVTLGATIHKIPPVSCRRTYVRIFFFRRSGRYPAVLSFYYIVFQNFGFCV